MRRMGLGLLGLCLAAEGCSYGYRIQASFRDGGLVLTAEREGWFAADPCAESLEIITRDPAPDAPAPYRSVWRIEQSGRGERVCAAFPIAYGRVPSGLRQKIAPETLKPGVEYEIVARGDGADGFGNFRIPAGRPNAIENRD